jgi:flagellar hook assembly protein FlgD
MLNNNSLMDDAIPLQFRLSQNYPNPFKERTVIKYCIAFKTRVKLTVYDSEGEEIKKIIDEEKKPGTYEIEFDTVETHLQNGTYSYRLEAKAIGGQTVDYQSEKKMQLQK